MALIELFGCVFLAFGPPFSMFLFTIAKDPTRVIVLITSAFFWLISLLISALIWLAVVPLKEKLAFALFISVIIQEVFRYLFYLFIKKAEAGLAKVQKASASNNMKFDSRIISYASGLGFGMISGAFSLVNVLGDMSGPGTLGIKGDSQAFYIVTSLITLCFILLHVCWSLILYLSLSMYTKKSFNLWLSVAIVLGSHLFVSGISLINNSKEPTSYIYSVLFSYITLIINVGYSVFILKRTYNQKLDK